VEKETGVGRKRKGQGGKWTKMGTREGREWGGI